MKSTIYLALTILMLLSTKGFAAETDPLPADDSSPTGESVSAAEQGELSGDDIYRKILENRFSSYIQELRMNSGDRGGNELATEIRLSYKNYRSKKGRIASKSIAKYRSPQDVRHLGYLVINKTKGINDEFIYQPSTRRVRRINLRGEAVFGTDFAFEDIIPQEFEDGSYLRLADSEIGNIDCYVVEVTPTEKADSEYSKFNVYVEKAHFVPIQTDYWDAMDIHIKQLVVDPDSIKGYEDEDEDGPKQIWISTRQKITQLKQDTWTELMVQDLEAKPKLHDRDFSQRELARSH